jgi:hypothetical protein
MYTNMNQDYIVQDISKGKREKGRELPPPPSTPPERGAKLIFTLTISGGVLGYVP